MKLHNWRLYACLVLTFTAIRPGQAQPNVVQEYKGEIRRQSASFFHGFVAHLDSLTSHGDSAHADVQSDGSFSFRNMPCGEYRLRITNYQGETIQQEFVSVTPQTPTVTVQLAEPEAARPPAGSVSVGRLQHPPAPKAFKAVFAAQKLSQAGEYEKAASKLEEALRISPDYSEAWTNLTVAAHSDAPLRRGHQGCRAGHRYRRAEFGRSLQHGPGPVGRAPLSRSARLWLCGAPNSIPRPPRRSTWRAPCWPMRSGGAKRCRTCSTRPAPCPSRSSCWITLRRPCGNRSVRRAGTGRRSRFPRCPVARLNW